MGEYFLFKIVFSSSRQKYICVSRVSPGPVIRILGQIWQRAPTLPEGGGGGERMRMSVCVCVRVLVNVFVYVCVLVCTCILVCARVY